MADSVDLSDLEPCDGTIEIIRLSFKRHKFEWGIKTAKDLIEKGYKVFINPVNYNVYTDDEYLKIIDMVNSIKPYGFSIVDTFGVMRIRDLMHIYQLVETKLSNEMVIGLHLHENLGLSYSLAQCFINISKPERNIVIDGSLIGMGRVPGNLCVEQIMEHMNYEFGTKYNLEPIYDAIDDYIYPLKNKYKWGYAIPYALSAKFRLHRTYAEFLVKKWKLRTSDIEKILNSVSKQESELFNQGYIEQLFRNYMSIKYDDSKDTYQLMREMEGRSVLLIGAGASINTKSDEIVDYVKKEKAIVIAVHCVPDFLKADYIFYSNIKRYDMLSELHSSEGIIISSNMLRYQILEANYVLDYSKLVNINNFYCDDSVMMIIAFLCRIGKKEITIAGFDGVIDGVGDFYIDELSRQDIDEKYSFEVKQCLKDNYSNLNIKFITKSYYEDFKDDERMGV